MPHNPQATTVSVRRLGAVVGLVAVSAGFYATIWFASRTIGELPLGFLRLEGKEQALAESATRSIIGMAVFVAILLAGLVLSGQRGRIVDCLRGSPGAGWVAATITATIQISMILVIFGSIGPRVFEASLFNVYLSSVTALGGGVLEEIVHRAFVILALTSSGFSNWTAIFVSAALFAINHVGWVDLAELQPASLVLQLSPLWGTFILGLALGFTFTESRFRLWPVIAAHAVINLTIEPWLLLAMTAIT